MITFDEFMLSNNKRTSFERFYEQALQDMFCSKPFLAMRDPAVFRKKVEGNAALMHELIARVGFLYEQELDKYADYKKAYVENQTLKVMLHAERTFNRR